MDKRCEIPAVLVGGGCCVVLSDYFFIFLFFSFVVYFATGYQVTEAGLELF